MFETARCILSTGEDDFLSFLHGARTGLVSGNKLLSQNHLLKTRFFTFLRSSEVCCNRRILAPQCGSLSTDLWELGGFRNTGERFSGTLCSEHTRRVTLGPRMNLCSGLSNLKNTFCDEIWSWSATLKLTRFLGGDRCVVFIRFCKFPCRGPDVLDLLAVWGFSFILF